MKKWILVCSLILSTCVASGWAQSQSGYEYITTDGVKMRFGLLRDGKGLYLANVEGEGEYEVIIPSEVNGLPVKSIGMSAFYGAKGVTSVVIPEGVYSVGYTAFAGCSDLTTVAMPTTLKSIEGGAFQGCRNLHEISLPTSLSVIGYEAFRESGLRSVVIPDTATLEEGVFSECHELREIVFPEKMECISDRLFEKCSSLEVLSLPQNMKVIRPMAFSECLNLKRIYCNMMVPPRIHKSVFGKWRLEVPMDTRKAGWADDGSTMPIEDDGITDIEVENWTSYDDDYDVLVQMNIGNMMVDILGSFKYVYPSATLRVPKGTKAQYEATPEWSRFAHIVEMDDTGIGSPSMVNGQCSMFNGIFDLQGRRLTQEPQQGVFIRDGRKVVKGN
ncbi:MAG: leucine-rich repeat domain-containing protein [Alloprevotella sp.]|nr:leucine-rich repeat domain-containing protein [Alloprevotella sp.]